MRIIFFVCLSFFSFNQIVLTQEMPEKTPEHFKLVVNESFGSDKIPKTLEKAPEGQWLISKEGKSGKSLKYIGNQEPINSDIRPITKILVKNSGFSSFILEADIEQCGRDYECRDVCIIFNHIDDNNYNFIHLASITGELCHGVFELKNGNLTLLTPASESPIIWGVKQWFHLRIEKGLKPEKLSVFLNNNLLWEIHDFKEGSGQIGFGAPDGSAKIDNLKIWAQEISAVKNNTEEITK